MSSSQRLAALGEQAAPARASRLGCPSVPPGEGYATEASRPLLDFAFGPLGLHRVIGRLELRNGGSARVLEKLGMRREAHLVENEWVKGDWQSELVYAILARVRRLGWHAPGRRRILTPSNTTEDHDMALSFGVTVLPDLPASRLVELMSSVEDNGFEIGDYDSHVLWQESFVQLTLAIQATSGQFGHP